MPRSRRASRAAAVVLTALVGLLAATGPAHAAGPVDRPGTHRAVTRDTEAGTAVDRAALDRGALDAAVARVVDDVVGAAQRIRTDVTERLAWQRDAIAAWWSGSAPGWAREAARVGPALWDLGESVGDLMRSQAVRWLSWVTGDAVVGRG